MLRVYAAQSIPSPADPFYYTALQTHRLTDMRWSNAPVPARMLRWALRCFVGDRQLVDMMVKRGIVSSAVGVGRARGRLDVPV